MNSKSIHWSVSVPESSALDRTQHWSVEVFRNGESLLTIESNFLCGKPDLSENDEKTIRRAARHLLSFIGGDPEDIYET